MDDIDSPGFWLGDDGIFYENVTVSVYRDGKNHFHLLLAEGFRHGVLLLNCGVNYGKLSDYDPKRTFYTRIMEKIKTSCYHVLEKIGSKPRAGFPWVMRRVVMKWTFGECRRVCLIPASNEPSDCLQAFGDCRESHILRCLQRGCLNELMMFIVLAIR